MPILAAFLSPFLKYICGGLLFVSLILGIALKLEQRHSHKLEQRNTELAAQLKAISTAKNEQHETTVKNIVKADDGRKKAETIAKRIEAAPLSGNCATPKEVLQADL